MNKIILSCNRGTAYLNIEPIQSKLITNTNTQSRISQDRNGLKVTCSKGTSSFWITKVPKIHMAIPKIMVSNRGTKYSKCKI
jgi:hypothetical protein